MKKSFSLQTMELAEAAVKDAENFGLTASIEKNGEEISIAYDSPAMVSDKPEQYMTTAEAYSMMKNYASEYEYQMKWMREDLGYMRENLFKHINNGHLPAISDAGMMKKALKSLGLEDSYEVKTPAVFVQY
jgi:hypothetical protein